jgi:hypothetical protein
MAGCRAVRLPWIALHCVAVLALTVASVWASNAVREDHLARAVRRALHE